MKIIIPQDKMIWQLSYSTIQIVGRKYADYICLYFYTFICDDRYAAHLKCGIPTITKKIWSCIYIHKEILKYDLKQTILINSLSHPSNYYMKYWILINIMSPCFWNISLHLQMFKFCFLDCIGDIIIGTKSYIHNELI